MASPTEANNLNLFPFSLEFNGYVPVNKYMRFVEDERVITSHFRGRCIKGTVVDLPPSVTGVVLTKAGKSEGTHVSSAFSTITLWEHDVDPNTAVLTELFDWIDVSKTVIIFFFIRYLSLIYVQINI